MPCRSKALLQLPRNRKHILPDKTASSRPREVRLFRSNDSQAVRIPFEFALSGERARIWRKGNRFVIEPTRRPTTVAGLLVQWKSEEPLSRDNQFPSIEDQAANPEGIS